MTTLRAFLNWLRRVPLIGWLALALALVAFLALRFWRLADQWNQSARIKSEALQARRAYVAQLAKAGDDAKQKRDAAMAEHKQKQDELRALEQRIATVNAASLADDINAFFAVGSAVGLGSGDIPTPPPAPAKGPEAP